jgi:large subunit ribosomal protein L5
MASATTETAPPARLKARYLEEIRPELVSRFGYTSVMQAPKLEKVTVNMGVGLAKQDSKMLKAATEQLATIAGQAPSVRRARKSIAAFKLREGMPVGVAVTLRGERGYEFLDRLISIAIPRIRDFRGLNARSFDGRGNYSMGVKEQIIFPEIEYDAIDMVRGLDITITTSAKSDIEAYALLAAFGMPFSPQGRPKGYDPEADAAAEQAHIESEAKAEAKAAQAEIDATEAAQAKAAAAEAKAARLAAGKPGASKVRVTPEAPETEAAPEAEQQPAADQAPEAEAAAPEDSVAEAEPATAAEAPAVEEAPAVAEPAAEEVPAVEEAPEEPQAATEPETTSEPAEQADADTTEKESTD